MTKSLSKQKETLFVDRQMKKIINNILLILFAGLTVQELHAQKLDQEHLNAFQEEVIEWLNGQVSFKIGENVYCDKKM